MNGLDEFLVKAKVRSRAEWGAEEPKGELEPDSDYDTVVIHHSGRSAESSPKAVQQKHFGRGWDDIGYHFVIDFSGIVYEGRRLMYKGAHTSHKNTGKVGILITGNFQPLTRFNTGSPHNFLGGEPKATQLNAAVLLINNLKSFIPSIVVLGGHRDWGPTECPGDLLYDKLGDLRTKTSLQKPAG